MAKTVTRDDDRRRPARDASVPQLFVLIECDRPSAGSARHVLRGVTRVEIGRDQRSKRSVRRSDGVLEVGVPDMQMSQPHARLVPRDGGWMLEDMGSKNGSFVDGERRASAPLVDGSVLELGHTLMLYREGPAPDDEDTEDLADVPTGLRTFMPALADVFENLGLVVQTDAAVLIQGETGTGKELLARAVHALAQRSGAFVPVNCGALPEALVESELYGHKKGAFSGAERDHLGLVRTAHHGTLFLDEIADLPTASQVALLRVLQEREVTPVGATQPVPVDIRVVAASHHDLEHQMTIGKFRHDLYARLAAYTVRLPPLRERREDIGLLLAELLPPGVKLTPAAAYALVDYDWPLNIRELASCLTVATALARGGTIRLEHLPDAIGGEEEAPALSDDDGRKRAELVALLQRHRGNVSAIARSAGKARAQIHRCLRRYDLDSAKFR